MMLAVATFALALGALQDPDKDKLKKFEEPFKDKDKDKKKDDEKKPKPGTEPNWDPLIEFEGDDDDWWVEIFTWTFGYPFRDTGMRYDDFPYYLRGPRYFTREGDSGKDVALTARVQVGRVEHDLMCYGGSGELRLPTGSSLSVDVVRYHESMPGRDDRLTLQEYAFNVGFAGHARPFQVTVGIGVGVLQGEGIGNVNFLVQADGEWFVSEPFRLHTRVGYMPFHGGGIADLRLELGIHVHRFAFLAGMRSLLNTRGADLTGPTLGVEIWF